MSLLAPILQFGVEWATISWGENKPPQCRARKQRSEAGAEKAAYSSHCEGNHLGR